MLQSMYCGKTAKLSRSLYMCILIYEAKRTKTSHSILLMSREQLNEEQKLQISMSCAGARALCSLSESKPNKEAMRKFGLVPLMSRLLKSIHTDLIVPIMGTCQNCASEVKLACFDFIIIN